MTMKKIMRENRKIKDGRSFIELREIFWQDWEIWRNNGRIELEGVVCTSGLQRECCNLQID